MQVTSIPQPTELRAAWQLESFRYRLADDIAAKLGLSDTKIIVEDQLVPAVLLVRPERSPTYNGRCLGTWWSVSIKRRNTS